MCDFKDAISFLKTIKSPYLFIKEELFTVCRFIYPQAYRIGLDDEEMKTIANVLKIDTLPIVEYQELMKCLIPRTFAPEQVVIDVTILLLSSKSNTPMAKVVCAVQWLTGIIGYGLTKTKKLDCLYSLFFDLLARSSIDLHLCLLIQLLTKPHLVRRKHLLILNRLRNERGKKKVYDSILSLFKHMHPALVSEDLPPPSSTQSLLSNLPESWKGFQMAKNRCEQNVVMKINTAIIPASYWDKATLSIIPQINYSSPNQNCKRTLMDIDSWQELGSSIATLDPPSQSMSLLWCQSGMVCLAHGNRLLQLRFSSSLNETLHAVFLRKQHDIFVRPEMREYGEKHLLQQLAVFQDYLSQPIPVVSSFLTKYLLTWTGEEHRVSVLRLLCHIHFKTYDELMYLIIEPLSMLFISGDIEFKCAIINMFKEFMKNLMLKEKWKEGKKPLFLNLERSWDEAEVYPKIFNAISDLISIGLSSENGNSFFVATCLSYYHMMLSIVCCLNCEYMVVPPPPLMYHSLFSHSLPCLSQACSLLVRYKNEVFYTKTSDTTKRKEKFKEEFSILGVVVEDYVRFLCADEPFSNREKSFIMKNVTDDFLKELSANFDLSHSSNICYHPAFAPYYITAKEKKMSISYKALYILAANKYPGIVSFIREFGPPQDL